MLFNDPTKFREDMLSGYVAAYPDYVMQVPGGVARAVRIPAGKVAVINGGGSGHYPAFCGIVGEGFMDGTVVGNVFTSPSAEDVLSVAHAVNQKAGILILGGNYAGDKMNFNIARDRLLDEGIEARSLFVTDDVASAAPEEAEKRRGNVGTFMVFKAAGAAAAEGAPLEEVVRLAKKANDRTRTMSVGFRGCTLPGQPSPLFVVPKGKMEVGQGIHGEPGVGEVEATTADDVAKLLVERVLKEAPADDSHRIAVILDGLGSTKYEELFVTWGSVRKLLEKQGYTLVEPEVGEFVTSLDMEGVALAVEFLDDDLERLWRAPCDTPAFGKGTTRGSAILSERAIYEASEESDVSYEGGTSAALGAAKFLADALSRMRDALVDAEPELAKIDGVAGDGDHGRGMVKGSTFAADAAQAAVSSGAAIGSVLKEAGRAWAGKAGGTSGVLWGSALEAAGEVVTNKVEVIDAALVARAVDAAKNRMIELGGAHQGDKTMLDALIPFCEEMASAASEGEDLLVAWKRASEVAQNAADETAKLLPKVGRARPAAERSLGMPDAGAVSMALCARVVLPEG